MAIFQAVKGKLAPIEPTTFSAAGMRERADIQQLLKQQIEVIAPDILVISEEFGEWEESRRRIDLLAIDKEANLVVIELKRTEPRTAGTWNCKPYATPRWSPH
jgi:RecB family endonuclease NucS